jgi:hypothetical protein
MSEYGKYEKYEKGDKFCKADNFIKASSDVRLIADFQSRGRLLFPNIPASDPLAE